MGDSSSSATAAVLLTVLQESTGRLATILFAHRFGQAIEPECKRYRFLADVLNDGALALDVLSPVIFSSAALSSSASSPSPDAAAAPFHHAYQYYGRALALCASGVLRALCGVAAGAAKASLSAHFARGGGGGNLAELNAKDGSQETVISLLGMLAGSLFVRAVRGDAAVWVSMAALIAVHLATNYAAVRAVRLRSLNRQRAQLVLRHYLAARGAVLHPAAAAARERVLSWRPPAVRFATAFPGSREIDPRDLARYRGERYVIVARRGGTRKIFLKEGATSRDALAAWFEALILCGEGDVSSGDGKGKKKEGAAAVVAAAAREEERERKIRDLKSDGDFWKAMASAGWDLDAGALETGPAVRIRVE